MKNGDLRGVTMNRVHRAVVFAADAHRGQFRKGKAIPYILHPMEAAAIAAGMTDDPEIIVAALLHDTIEDAGVSAEEIAAEFGPRVALLVQAVSEEKRESLPAQETWRIRKEETVAALHRQEDRAVKMLVVADKLSNIRALYQDHRSLGSELWKRFNQKDPMMHAWYYRAVAEATAELREYPAWQEYCTLVEKVFAPYTHEKDDARGSAAALEEFEENWRKVGRGYRAVVGDYELTAKPTRLAVPPTVSLRDIIKRGGRPIGWEWEFKDTKFKITFGGYALSLDEAVQNLKRQLLIFTK